MAYNTNAVRRPITEDNTNTSKQARDGTASLMRQRGLTDPRFAPNIQVSQLPEIHSEPNISFPPVAGNVH